VFTRYFSPTEHNVARTNEEILAVNDVELFDLVRRRPEFLRASRTLRNVPARGASSSRAARESA
jgi:hypothetical protein